MLAYSSMENMGLIAIAAAAGTTLAIAALLLHVLAHGIGKTVLFLASGQLQAAHGSTAIADITAVLRRSRLIGVSLAVGCDRAAGAAAVRDVRQRTGHRPFAGRRPAHLGAGRGHAADRGGLRRAGTQLGPHAAGRRPPARQRSPCRDTVAAALLVGVAASIALGITAGPLDRLVHRRGRRRRGAAMSRNWLRHRISQDGLAEMAEELLGNGFRLGLVAAHEDDDAFRVVYLFLAGWPDRRVELECVVPEADPAVRSLAYLSFPAGRFEREMADLYGIRPVGHPKPRRLVRHAHWPEDWYPMRNNAGPAPEFEGLGHFPFVTVEGPGVYEIPVGPVHAGLIEPGHFRFSVAGETVLRLKARLWFVHRGLEKLFEDRPADGAVDLAERVSGDTSVAHALAHSLAVEDALGVELPDEVHRLRALLVELERLYNHVADLGALANDVGFALANAHAQRIREQLLRLNAAVTGHRLLRGAVRPGAVTLQALPDVTELQFGRSRCRRGRRTDPAQQRGLRPVRRDRGAVPGRRSCPRLSRLRCARQRHAYRRPTRTSHHRTTRHRDRSHRWRRAGPLHGAARRIRRISRVGLSLDRIAHRPNRIRRETAPPRREARSGIGIVEGWRGTIVHRVEIDAANRITRAKIVDPSWFNWPALPVAMADTIVPDFPLANKSFNQSYAGNDL